MVDAPGFAAAAATAALPAEPCAGVAGSFYVLVLEKRDADRVDAGIVRFKHWGTKQDGKIVFEGERTVLIKRRSHWERR